MKKFLMTALLISAIPAVAVGQTVVSCHGCTHYVSVYQGEGGLIATAAEDAEMVTFVATCEGVTRSGELMPNDDGVVSMLLAGDYACNGDDEDNAFQIGPIMDGGWYWITMEDNSAVGGLVAMDILDNAMTEPTGAGDGVMMTDGKGATLLKETATGRVGILPTILPVPEMEPDPVNVCDYTTSAAGVHSAETKDCMLGDGKAVIRALGPVNPATAKRDPIPNEGMVQRPAAGSYQVSFDLWGNGTGHYSNVAGSPRLGHAGGTPLDATISAVYGGAGPAGTTDVDTGDQASASGAAVGLVMNADTTNDDIGHLTIYPNSTYCDPTAKPPANHPLTVTIRATGDTATDVTPTLVVGATATPANLAATMTLTVVCPAASANLGQELVPENPFPTDK